MSIINQHLVADHKRSLFPHDRYILHVWSGDRDISVWPDAHEYEILLPVQYRSIRRISLLTVEFCSSAYTINTDNDYILVQDNTGSNITYVQIPEGSYTPTDMQIALSTAIDTAIPGTTTVTFDSSTRKFTITNSGSGLDFLIADSQNPSSPNYIGTFANRLAWKKLGFTDAGNLAGPAVPPGTGFSSASMVDLKEDRFIIMEIESPSIMTGHMASTGDHVRPFAKIIFDTDSSTNFPASSNVYDFVSAPLEFKNVSKIDRLKIRFRRPSGAAYNFNGLEHSFTLEFITK